jgi:hypothetical protein
MSNPITCPTWCEREHPTSYLAHERYVAELNADGGELVIEVTVNQHVQPGRVDAPVMRLFAHQGGDHGETTILDLAADQAATLGRIIALLASHGPGHRFGVALTDAAAVILAGGGR